MVLGAGLGASLYDPAFATLGRIFGAGARRPITLLTLAGGFASTVGWPATHFLIGAVGWRGTYVVYAAADGCGLRAALCRSRCRAIAPQPKRRSPFPARPNRAAPAHTGERRGVRRW